MFLQGGLVGVGARSLFNCLFVTLFDLLIMSYCSAPSKIVSSLSRTRGVVRSHPSDTVTVLRRVPAPRALRNGTRTSCDLLVARTVSGGCVGFASSSLVGFTINCCKNRARSLMTGKGSFCCCKEIVRDLSGMRSTVAFCLGTGSILRDDSRFGLLKLVSRKVKALGEGRGLFSATLGDCGRSLACCSLMPSSLYVACTGEGVNEIFLCGGELSDTCCCCSGTVCVSGTGGCMTMKSLLLRLKIVRHSRGSCVNTRQCFLAFLRGRGAPGGLCSKCLTLKGLCLCVGHFRSTRRFLVLYLSDPSPIIGESTYRYLCSLRGRSGGFGRTIVCGSVTSSLQVVARSVSARGTVTSLRNECGGRG